MIGMLQSSGSARSCKGKRRTFRRWYAPNAANTAASAARRGAMPFQRMSEMRTPIGIVLQCNASGHRWEMRFGPPFAVRAGMAGRVSSETRTPERKGLLERVPREDAVEVGDLL